MGTDPNDPSSLFRRSLNMFRENMSADTAEAAVAVAEPEPPAGPEPPKTEAAAAEVKPPKAETDGLFVKRHLCRAARGSAAGPGRLAPGRRPKAADVQKELDGLTKEFGGYTLNRANTDPAYCSGPYLSVKTDPIVLEDEHGTAHEMGEFEIYLDLRLSQGSRVGAHPHIRAKALSPNRAAKNEDVVHPHVEGTRICFGHGAVAVDRALSDGRVADAFSLTNQILHTYNRESPYAQLETWHDEDGDEDDSDVDYRECVDCGEGGAENDCVSCANPVCDGCMLTCSYSDHGGDDIRCPQCARRRFVRCADCGDAREEGHRLCIACRFYVPGTNPAQYRCEECNEAAAKAGLPTTPTEGTFLGNLPNPGTPYAGTFRLQPAAVAPPADGGPAGPGQPQPEPRAGAGGELIGSGGEPDAPFGAPGDPLDDVGDDRTTRGWAGPG